MAKTQYSINHLAFIMDGNRRWAVEQGMKKTEGHRHGLDNFHKILRHCKKIRVKNVSLYGFSTENWNRSKIEVETLLALLNKVLVGERNRWLEHQVRLRFIGDLSHFSQSLQQSMKNLEEETKQYEQTVFVCLSYGGHLEMVQAAKSLEQSGLEYTEENFKSQMWSHDMDEIDLLVRTGGNHRLSNFLPWQSAYAELYFTDTLWPALTGNELDKIVLQYQNQVVINKGK